MPFAMKFHHDNSAGFLDPHLLVTYAGGASDDFAATGQDAFGPLYDVQVMRLDFHFKLKDGPGATGQSEGPALERVYRPLQRVDGSGTVDEIWCRGDKAFIYPVLPKPPEPISAPEFLAPLAFEPSLYLPRSGGVSGLGANVLADGRVLFGLYHPNAARVFVMGSFNEWQRPSSDTPDPTKFVELDLYRGYFGIPNTWLAVTDMAHVGDEYKFCVIGGVPSDEKSRLLQYFTDPYSRDLGPDFGFNNSVIVDPSRFQWHDSGWQTPDISQIIFYELSVYGFTEGDPDIAEANRGMFAGITERIRAGYFGELGVNALALMPLAEVPSPQGAHSLGYDPSLFFSVERDFGGPDDLRELVDAAHGAGLAVVLDVVFNHTSSGFNPLWRMILEHPGEEQDAGEGGLYFGGGGTPWGNRINTGKIDVQNMLIDACRLMIHEYHVDGFRLDATHHDDWMAFDFLRRLAEGLKQVKPSVLLVAENLPNQSDINRQGFDGYAQWCDPFHDKLKALLREGQFSGDFDTPDKLGDIFYFSKAIYAAHTNNTVNYSESHDETSIPYEVGTNPVLNHPAAKERKGRLGLFAALTALGQPMIYMGQEFNAERDRNYVRFDWPDTLAASGFYQWTRRLIHLRRRYPGLKLAGYDPAGDGRFSWIIAPWLAANRGGGQKVIGWRSHPNGNPFDAVVVMMNFAGFDVTVDVDFGLPGVWVKLADIDRVNDIPPEGSNSTVDPTALRTADGNFANFTLPSSSGFIYKWQDPL